ncbi:unnamed protein product [Gemmata massiliana]|uniref:Uncharacterized protein n=1 Tax=Gemmata massiliana TaxID=1210884 RepID=A0A6P2D1Y1_9BACT|nr:unnamed protein product [Gemmata massiliana]
MASSDYGGYAYRNGRRVEEWSDAVLSPDGIQSTPGGWPGWTIEAARSGGSYAQAVLDACHAEEMRDVIGLLVYAKDMKDRSGDTPAYRAKKEEGWARARAILAKLNGQS